MSPKYFGPLFTGRKIHRKASHQTHLHQHVRETSNDCGVKRKLPVWKNCPTPLHGKYEESPQGQGGQADKASAEQV